MTTELMNKPDKLMRVFFFSMDDSPYSEAWVTPYSFQHLFSGIISYPLLKVLGLHTPLNLILSNILHLLYEAKDILITYRIRKFNGRYLNFNSLRNSVGDHIIFTLGQFIGWILFHGGIRPVLFQYLVVALYLIRITMYILHSD